MIKNYYSVAILLLAFVLSSCSGNQPEEEVGAADPTEIIEETSTEHQPTPDEILTGPGPRIGSLIYFNPIAEKAELIGGWSCDIRYRFDQMHFHDIWNFDIEKSEWVSMGDIAVENMISLGYDSESNKLIIVSQAPLETWAYDPLTHELENMAPDDMPPADTIISRYLFGMPMAYDSESDQLILYGGAERPDLVHDDTWAYDYNNNTWTNMQPENGPPERSYHQLVYDSESDRVVLWGGMPNLEDDTNIWAYDYNTNIWEELENVGGPETHFEAFGMIYRPIDDRIYLYSGFQREINADYDLDNDREEMMNEPATWSYDLNSNSWEQIETELNPGERQWYSMVYDHAADKIIMYGGETTSKYDGKLTNAVWLFDFETMQWRDATPNAMICED